MNDKERQEKLLKMMEEGQNQSWSGVSRSQVPGNEISLTVSLASNGDGRSLLFSGAYLSAYSVAPVGFRLQELVVGPLHGIVAIEIVRANKR